MVILSPLVANLHYLAATFIDALSITLVLSVTLWWSVFRPLKTDADADRSRHEVLKDSVVEAVITVDSDGFILSFNPSAQEIFGYKSDEINGRNAADLFSDDILGPESLTQLIYTDTLLQHTHEVISKHKTGRLLNLEMSVSRISVYGNEQFLLVMRDMTARKKAEAALRDSELRFRQIFDQSEDAILFLHPETSEVIDLNATATDLFGFSKEEIRTEGIALLCSNENQESLTDFAMRIKHGDLPIIDRFVCRREDSKEFILSVRCKTMTLQGEQLVCANFKDITHRVRMEEQALEMQSRLIQTDKMTTLGLMVSGVAHEINNPNNSILLNARLLERACLDALPILKETYEEHGEFQLGGLPFAEMERHLPEMVAGVIDGSRRISSIVNELKAFVRATPADINESLNVNRAVTGAVSILHHEIARLTCNFHEELGKDLPLIKGNSQQLTQVFINLLLNACQSLPSAHSGIWLFTSYDNAAEEIDIIVRDEGVGIPDEVGRRIMEPFFTTRVDSGGTGLGLSISNTIIKEHSGTLEFHSVPGMGTTFIVRLPVENNHAEESA